MKLLIVYGTTEGHTRKICRFLQEKAQQQGHTVDLCDTSDNPLSPSGYDVVLVAASVHIQAYQSSVKHYIKHHIAALNSVKSAFLSVSLTAAGDEEKSWDELESLTDNFVEDLGWKPAKIEYVAGALLYTQYNFFKRFIMRLIAKNAGGDTDTSGDYEYTDWKRLEAFLQEFLGG